MLDLVALVAAGAVGGWVYVATIAVCLRLGWLKRSLPLGDASDTITNPEP